MNIIQNICDAIRRIKIFVRSPNTTTQLTFTCSKSTIEILEKGAKNICFNNQNARTTSMTVVLVLLLLTVNRFHLLLR